MIRFTVKFQDVVLPFCCIAPAGGFQPVWDGASHAPVAEFRDQNQMVVQVKTHDCALAL